VVQEITTVKPRCGGNLRESSIALRIDPVMIIAPPLLAAPTFTDYLMIQIKKFNSVRIIQIQIVLSPFSRRTRSHPSSHFPIRFYQRPHYYLFHCHKRCD
jgi:hypothetical protein